MADVGWDVQLFQWDVVEDEPARIAVGGVWLIDKALLHCWYLRRADRRWLIWRLHSNVTAPHWGALKSPRELVGELHDRMCRADRFFAAEQTR